MFIWGGLRPCRAVLLLCLALLLLAPPANARTEYDVKAAYLYNFIKFVQWRRDVLPDGAPLNICVLGESPLERALEPITELTARNHTLTLETLDKDDDLSKCHVLVVSRSEQKFLEKILARLEGQPALTVSDMDGFVERGGMIEFVNVGNVIRFQINLKEINTAGLSVSAKLLKVAQEVWR